MVNPNKVAFALRQALCETCGYTNVERDANTIIGKLRVLIHTDDADAMTKGISAEAIAVINALVAALPNPSQG